MNAQQAASQPAPAAPQAAQATPPAEALYEVRTPDGVRKEPLSVLQERYVAHSAAERRVMEQNQRIVQLEQQNQSLAQKAQFSENLQRRLVEDPAAFVAEAERLARLANGSATQEDQAAVARGHAPQTMQILQQMQTQLAELQQERLGERATSDIRAALAPYEVFKNNETARKMAETTLAAMRVTAPEKPLSELASVVHTQMNDLLSQRTQQQYQTRVDRIATNPPAPSGHTPGMTSPEPPPTVKDMGNGVLRRRLTAFLNGPNGIQ